MFYAKSKGKPNAIDKFEGTVVDKVNKARVRVKNKNYYHISEKLCRKVDEINIGNVFYLKTPFGTVSIKKKSSNELFICGGQTSGYTAIVDNLKKNSCYDADTVISLLDYLSLPKNSSEEFEILSSKEESSNEDRSALKYLCAILILAEPYRLRDDGRYIRAILRKIYDDFQKNIPSPMKKSFGSKKSGVKSDIPLFQRGGKQSTLAIFNRETNDELKQEEKRMEDLLACYTSDDESDTE